MEYHSLSRKTTGKKQTKAQQDQASHSILLYYELILAKDTLLNVPSLPKDGLSEKVLEKPAVKEKFLSKPLAGASWRAEYTGLANEIRVRHCSPKTLKTYKQWLRQFQTYTRSKPPALLSTADVKEFLTSLAVKRQAC